MIGSGFGTDLSDVYGSFTSTTPFSHLTNLPPYGIRGAPMVAQRDLSGSLLFQIEKLTKLNSLEETDFPKLDITTEQLGNFIDAFKNMSAHYQYLLSEITSMEKNILEIEKSDSNFLEAMDSFESKVLTFPFHTSEHIEEYVNAKKVLQEKRKHLLYSALEAMKAQVISLTEKSSTTKSNLDIYKDFLRTGTSEMLANNIKPNLCTVCFENEIDKCIVPCGHTFCSKCVDKSQGSGLLRSCMSCRSPVEKTVKIFLS